MDNDIRRRLKDVLILNRVTINSISHGTAEQRRLNRQINAEANLLREKNNEKIVSSYAQNSEVLKMLAEYLIKREK